MPGGAFVCSIRSPRLEPFDPEIHDLSRPEVESVLKVQKPRRSAPQILLLISIAPKKPRSGGPKFQSVTLDLGDCLGLFAPHAHQFLDTVTPIRPILLRSPTVYRQTVWLPLLDWSRLVKSRAGATARTSLPRICRTFPVCGRRSIFRCWLRSPGRCRRAGHGCTAWWKPPSVPTMPHLTVSGALGFVSQRSRCRE